MKKLIITAHPNPNGFTHKIAQTFKKSSEEKHEIKVIDLYNEQFSQWFLSLNETNRPENDENRQMMQDMITRADELVFIYPLRRWDAPAILKNWFDTNMTQGFAFKYTGKTLPEKLLSWKNARIFFTCWGPARVNYTLWLWHRLCWKFGRLGYCWIKLKTFKAFTQMNKYRKPEDRETMLEAVKKNAKNS